MQVIASLGIDENALEGGGRRKTRDANGNVEPEREDGNDDFGMQD